MTGPMATRPPSRLAALSVAAALVSLAGAACKKETPRPVGAQDPAALADGAGAGSPPGEAQAAGAGDHVRPFFYRIDKDGQTSYLLGTMHLGVAPERLPPPVWDRLTEARSFAMETNLMDPSLLTSLQRTDGKTLADELGPAYWKKLEDVLGAQLAAGLKGMKASTAAAMLEMRGLPMTQSMDLALLQRAREQELPIVYLEEARVQQTLLDRWLDVRALKLMLDDPGKTEEKNQRGLAAYAAGDEATLEQLTFDRSAWTEAGRSEAELDQMMKELLFDRNASWIAPIERLHAEGNAFIAVGAAHLIGPGSVLELLRARGFSVARVE
jgi:uncharacterized protein